MANTPNRRRGELSRGFFEDLSLARMRDEMTNMWHSIFGGGSDESGLRQGFTSWVPNVDIVEGERDVTVRAEIPGLDAQDLDITLTGNTLVVAGEKREKEETRRDAYYRSEMRYGTFRRAIELPEGIDPDKVSAEYDRGVLTVRIGRTQTVQPKRIPVTGSDPSRRVEPRREKDDSGRKGVA